jgi:general nucleoside transport system permease protein
MQSERQKQIVNAVLVPVLAIISGLVIAAGLILLTGKSPLEAFGILFRAGFGCQTLIRCAFFTTLERATPVILTGLSAVVAFRSGMFSIGQEGQYLMGAVVAAWLGYAIHLPIVIHAAFIMICSMAAGAAYGWIPGILRVKLQVNELLVTIVLNAMAVLFAEYIVQFPLRADQGATAHSPVIDETAWLPVFLSGSKWGFGFIIAILAVIAVFVYLWRSVPGYEQRMAGQAKLFALFGGIPSDSAAIRAMLISGALSGLAGSIEILGVHRRIMSAFSVGIGFDGLSVAILGQVHPIGVVLVSILFAGLRLGAQLGLQLEAQIPRELGGTVIGLMILFVSMRQFYENNIDRVRGWFNRRSAAAAPAAGKEG